jgi:hypothetical protein
VVWIGEPCGVRGTSNSTTSFTRNTVHRVPPESPQIPARPGFLASKSCVLNVMRLQAVVLLTEGLYDPPGGHSPRLQAALCGLWNGCGGCFGCSAYLPKEGNGCGDPRNGLILCALHHRALDARLFCINPVSRRAALCGAAPHHPRTRRGTFQTLYLRSPPCPGPDRGWV